MEIIGSADKKALDAYTAKEFSQKILSSNSFGPEQNVMIKDKEESQISKADLSRQQTGLWTKNNICISSLKDPL